MSNPILDFYAFPERLNSAGFCFNDIFRWSAEDLEVRHDYIQWFFPTTQPSAYHPGAPILNIDELCFFSTIGSTRKMQRKAFDRMMEFYGIKLGWFKSEIRKPIPTWISPVDHNYLRITRIITSLKLFHNDRQARKLMRLLASNAGYFPPDSMRFWRQAEEQTDPDIELKKMVGLL